MRARERYSLSRFVEAYTDLYEEVCRPEFFAHVA
jgi:hypothetical protein